MIFRKSMIKYSLALILIVFFVVGCGEQILTRQELTYRYASFNMGPLFYCGSNEHYHYFLCRPADSFVNIKVKRDEIKIGEVKPKIGLFGKPFPGYYRVDPNDNYNRLEVRKIK